MADYTLRMRALGVQVIGACCGSTPEHLAAMRTALDGPPLEQYEPAFDGSALQAKPPSDSATRRAARRAQRAEA